MASSRLVKNYAGDGAWFRSLAEGIAAERPFPEDRRASLEANAPLFQDKRVQAWEFRAPAGAHVQIDMRSSAIDPYLLMVGPGLEDPITDDDSGDRRNARLSPILSEGGTFYVLASSFRSAQGPYELEASFADLSHLSPRSRVLRLGATANGTLTRSDPAMEGRYVQVYELQAPTGTRVRVRLQSGTFDTYLYVSCPDLPSMLRDDDGSVRYFSVHESALLQSFPPEYVFSGSRSEAMRQIGNAAPTAVCSRIAQAIANKLRNGPVAVSDVRPIVDLVTSEQLQLV